LQQSVRHDPISVGQALGLRRLGTSERHQ